MDNDSLLAEIYDELLRTGIGEQFAPRHGDLLYHRAIIPALTRLPRGEFSADLAALPSILFDAPEVRALGIGPRGAWAFNEKWRWSHRRADQGESCIYWNGHSVEKRIYPGHEKAWSDEFRMFAAKVLDAAPDTGTIVEIGSGAGSVTFHLIDEAAKRNRSGLSFLNVDRDPSALAFSTLFSRRHALPVDHVLMDVATSLSQPEELLALAKRVKSPAVVITHGSLHPYYTDEQYARLFPFIVKELGVTAGLHLERRGFRTPSFAKLLELAGVGGDPSIKPAFTEWASDPFDSLERLAPELEIAIIENIDLFPHFPPRNAPSFLHWARA